MAIRVAINHRTTYEYDRAINLSPHVIRLRPAPHTRTPIVSYSLRISPEQHFINWQQDPFGNFLARVVFPERTRKLEIEVDLVADMVVINPFDFYAEDYALKFPFEYEPLLKKELGPYLEVTEDGHLLREWLGEVPLQPTSSVDFLVGLNQRLQKDIGYIVRLEPGIQTCEETLSLAKGSCRDSAQLLVQICRHLGLAARFTSGYLIQLKPDQAPTGDGAAGTPVDFVDLHAWAEVYLPGAGWIGLDATSGMMAGEGHIPLASTPAPQSAAAITGLAEAADTKFSFSMTLQRVNEARRVSAPYTDQDWVEIQALGLLVDERLKKDDVRLTLGGEPTFVSASDMDSPQWTIAALGKDKRKLAVALLKKLAARFAPGGVPHFGQGKWYPGEPLPRWALSWIWRTDGQAVWHNLDLIADEERDYGYQPADALAFARELTARLGLPARAMLEATESPGADGLSGATAGIVLPMACALDEGLDEGPTEGSDKSTRWVTSIWKPNGEAIVLIGGDSAMGYRLPLSELPPVPDNVRPREYSPLEQREGLRPAAQPEAPGAQGSLTPDVPENEKQFAPRVLRTALGVQVREGRLYVFLPPLQRADPFIDLVALIEKTAATLRRSIILEGYLPAFDPRLSKLSVTPDPGVIEVNIHPAGSWPELVEHTEVLYQTAAETGLITEKFMLDGRHSGTGGGNHVTLGGPTPADSPLLRRPQLLASLVTYWQLHPSLSYLFSGRFIGPTSQAPRVDEARHESLYELEIALDQIYSEDVPPWLVDRLFRNLLTDVTGNTHRAEFCIDKLYSPDSQTGRLGLLELRAFEMPPHARMSLVQMLLIRSLVAWFWRKPLHRRLARWGTALHDRFMLPHFVRADFEEVVADLNKEGFAFRIEWLEPFFEFRFPVCGRLQVDGIELEIRNALEPWHVTGEENAGGAAARLVDSALERLQVYCQGLDRERYTIACNGYALPLQSTGVPQQYVAGVRFKAWQMFAGLHPTIPVHAPLKFDIVDLAAGRSIGGCTYHVEHPGGRNPETFPVNANEAEARRLARFRPEHTPGPISLRKERANVDYPYTLDLRRQAPQAPANKSK